MKTEEALMPPDDIVRPYVGVDKQVPEFTLQAVLLGFVLSVLFNAANAYLGLKIGLTVSASIPSAIISMTALRLILPKLLGRNGTILENNIVHTIAATGEALAGAIIFTVPALFFLGQQVSNGTVFLLGATGGTLGILMMIPLRQALVVHEHKTLPFPEGKACAEVLIAGDKGGAGAAPVFWGIGAGGVFKFAMSGLSLFKDSLFWEFPSLHMAGFGYEVSPLLVGVGYLVGLRIAGVLLAGGLLGFFVLIPLIHALGGHNIVYPGTVPIDTMSTMQLRAVYIKYIGAGGVAFGGLVSLAKSLPDIFSSLSGSLKAVAKARAAGGAARKSERDWEHSTIVLSGGLLGFLAGAFAPDAPWSAVGMLARLAAALLGGALGTVVFYYVARSIEGISGRIPRTEQDIPLPLVGIGVLAMFGVLWLSPLGLGFLEAAVVLLFCFFFVAVSARMVGLIGTTNQPVSGMTITALLAMTLLFVALGHDPATVKAAAILGGAVVCIAISLSGDMSQDLKTAALVGGTPWKVQLAEVLGTLISAVRTGFILLILYKAYGFGSPTPEHPHPLEAPQSQLMAKLVEGATGGTLPWSMLGVGAGIGLVAELCGISALALAIGLYLPITNWPMIMLGGVIAWLAAKKRGARSEEHDAGSLFASGLIAGDALTGIALAALTVAGLGNIALRDPGAGDPVSEAILSSALYAAVAFALYRFSVSKPKHA